MKESILTQEERQELMELLPQNIIVTKKLSEKAKLVLADLLFRSKSEFSKENGYFYVTNADLMTEFGISNRGIGIILTRLSDMDFISRKVGKYRGNASEYRVNIDTIADFSDFDSTSTAQGTYRVSTFSGNEVEMLLGKIWVVQEKCNRQQSEIDALKAEVEALKGELGIKGEVPKFTTESEVDTETEIESMNSSIVMATDTQTARGSNDSVDILHSSFDTSKVIGVVQRVDKDTNQKFTNLLERIEHFRQKAYDSTSKESAYMYLNEARRLVSKAQSLSITDKQRKLLADKSKCFDGIERCKAEYFSRNKSVNRNPLNEMDADNLFCANLLGYWRSDGTTDKQMQTGFETENNASHSGANDDDIIY